MSIIVDTCIWSEALRRKKISQSKTVLQLEKLINDSEVIILGCIRQEILSGIKEQLQFNRLKKYLEAFPDKQISTTVYENAAEYFNICRTKGIQGSNTDFLLCACSAEWKIPIFTSDKDFIVYKKVLPITLV